VLGMREQLGTPMPSDRGYYEVQRKNKIHNERMRKEKEKRKKNI
jgi:hypothetical protein